MLENKIPRFEKQNAKLDMVFAVANLILVDKPCLAA